MKRFVTVCLVICIMLTPLMLAPAIASAEDGGITFGRYSREYYPRVKQGDELYYMSRALTEPAQTYEAWVNIPADTDGAGVLLGNRNDGDDGFVNIEVDASGSPCYLFCDSTASTHSITFDTVSLFTGKWTHLAIVHDDSGTVSCYVNGELADSAYLYPDPDSAAFKNPITVGGDSQYQNHPPFRGSVRGVSLFSDARTADEVLSDCKNGTDIKDPDIIASYTMTSDKAGSDIADDSGNGIDLLYSDMWLTEAQMELIRERSDLERAYSFAVIGDTQYTTQFYPGNLKPMYQWIVDNKDALGIEYVIGLGDITNRDTAYEWDIAKDAISVMNGAVPYSLIRGNHDLKAYSAAENAAYHLNHTGESVALGASTRGAGFDENFANDSAYTVQFTQNGGFYDNGSVMNTWRLLEIESSKWLLLNLDYAPSDDVLKWAADVVDAHPDHKVIVSTHGYIDRNGEHLPESAYAGEKGNGTVLPSGGSDVNLGAQIWEELVSQHENIQLVLCGHIGSSRITTVQRQGKNGNTVTEMLVDPQSYDNRFRGAGFVAMLYFNADGSAFEVEYLSTTSESAGLYYRSINQFTVDLK